MANLLLGETRVVLESTLANPSSLIPKISALVNPRLKRAISSTIPAKFPVPAGREPITNDVPFGAASAGLLQLPGLP